jgi:catechol 2,3-dioxygenase-like lactoylglutathione lyase family enzyme
MSASARSVNWWQGVVLAALCLGLGSVPAAGGEPALLRTTLIVADLERSIEWYRLLGFEPEQQLGGPRDPDSAFPLAARAGRFRLVIMAPPAGRGGRIGLLEFADERPPVVHARTDTVGIGSAVFVVEAPDARAVFAALSAAGARSVTPAPAELRRRDAEGVEGVGWVFHVFDPDGILVEVLQPPFPVR